jgi:acetyl esterase
MASLAFHRFVLKTLLSLPPPIILWLCGEKAVRRDGRTLDARFQALARMARDAPPPGDYPVELIRAGVSQAVAVSVGEPDLSVSAEALSIDGPRGPIPLRAYRPAEQNAAAPVLVFAHFGGGVVGDLETCDVLCRILARIARCPVVSVDYRLAPEHPFPAGLDDVLAAFRWARDNAPRFGAPAGQAAIGGDSMGGNLAAVIPQDLKRAGEPQPALQLLIYPAVDITTEVPLTKGDAGAYPLSPALIDWFTTNYLGPDGTRSDLRASPMLAEDLTGLAPAIMITAGFDPVLGQGEAYVERLREAGVPVMYRCFDSLVHGFSACTGVIPAVDVACREIAGMVREAFEGRIG